MASPAQVLVAAAGAGRAPALQASGLAPRVGPEQLLVAAHGLHILVAAAGLRLHHPRLSPANRSVCCYEIQFKSQKGTTQLPMLAHLF